MTAEVDNLRALAERVYGEAIEAKRTVARARRTMRRKFGEVERIRDQLAKLGIRLEITQSKHQDGAQTNDE